MDLILNEFVINGKKLCYKYFYSNSEETIIFIHGFSLDHRSWLTQINPFKNRYNLLIYDQIGYGRSDNPGNDPVSAHKDLYYLMDHLNINKAHLVGFSMGGGVVLNFALSFPNRVSSVCLAGSVCDGYSFEHFGTLSREIWGIGDVNKTRVEWLKIDLFKYILNTDKREQFKKMVDDYSGWHWINDYKVEHLDPPAYFQLEKIRSPTLILVGENDMSDFIRVSEILEKEIPDTIRVIMPTGHMINMEDPIKFNQVLSNFLTFLQPKY